MMKEKKKNQKDKEASRKIDRVTQKDFGKVKPRRIVPGVMGRSAWFVERAGSKSNALSIDRMRVALDMVRRMEDLVTGDNAILDQAYEALDKSGLARRRPTSPVLIEKNGSIIEVEVATLRKKTGLSAINKPVRVQERTSWAILVIPVDEQAATYLDLGEVVGAELSDLRNFRLIESFRYLPEHGLVVGRIEKGGIYQTFAFPKHPWLRHTFDVLCRYWKWVAIDPEIRKLTKAGAKGSFGILDRMCQLILCAPEYMQVGDLRVFHQAGVGFPPGYKGGERLPGDPGLPPGIGGEGNICERCLGNFLGEIDVIDDIVIAPPIVKWCWRRRPHCSRWRSIGPFPDSSFHGIGRVTQIDVHPANGNILIAGAAGGGVWRTENGGTTWRPLMELQPTLTIGAVAIAPSNPKIMYAASGEDGGDGDPAWGGVGIYRSTDGGMHWTLAAPVPSTRFSAIVIDPTAPDTIYAAGKSGLHKSTDGGVTWITNPGLASLFDGWITDIVIAHDDPRRIYIGVCNDGVYRSTTGGEQVGAVPAFTRLDGVNQLPSGADARWIKLAIGRNGADGSNFIAVKMGAAGSRIFRTTDGGNTWTELAQNVASTWMVSWCSVIAVDPTNQDVMYAGGQFELMRTTNGGANIADWTYTADTHSDMQDIVFDPNDSTLIYLANDGGVYRTTDRGNNWTFASGRLAVTQFYNIDIAERDKDIVGGGAQDNGVYYRNNSGNWRHIPWGDGTQIAIDPTDTKIFYFSAQNGLHLDLGPPYTNIRKSTDGGASHQPIGENGLSGWSPFITILKLDPTDPIMDPANNRTLLVCGNDCTFRSTDGGQNWRRVDDRAGNAFTTNGTITTLEFAANDPSILYLGTSSGALYRGVNGGSTAGDWARIDTIGSSAEALFPNVQIQAVRVNPKNADDIWVVFGGEGVNYTARPNMILNPLGISHLFRSTDAGANWVDASGLFDALSLPDVPTSAIAISDVDGDTAYVGTDVGVFRTTDGGMTWATFQDGLPRSPVVSLHYNRRYDRLFAATMGRGVYVRDV